MSYAQARESADRLIKKRGRAMTLLSRAVGAYSPSAGAVAVTTTNVAAWGIQQSLTSGRSGDDQRETVDTIVVVAPSITTAPKAGDGWLIASDTYEVLSVETKAPDGTVLVYVLKLRRGD